MEYPTLFTAGTRWLAPRQSNSPEGVTVHEAGHQFWYAHGRQQRVRARVARRRPQHVLRRARAVDRVSAEYRVERFFGGFIPWQYRDMPLRRATDGNGLNGYRAAAESDAPAHADYRYWPGTHAYITYSKTALWLQHARALSRLGHAAANPVDLLRALEVPPSAAGGFLRRGQRSQRAGPDLVLRPGLSQLERLRLRRRAIRDTEPCAEGTTGSPTGA